MTDVDVIELHDCFSANELITYEALGLCPVGKAGEMVDRGDNTYGGKYVVNPSGGLISKGHPLGATGKPEQGSLDYRNTQNHGIGCVIPRGHGVSSRNLAFTFNIHVGK